MTEAEALEALRVAIAAEQAAEAILRETERARREAVGAREAAARATLRAKDDLDNVMRGRGAAARRQGAPT